MTDRRPVALVSGALTEVADADDLPIGVIPTGTSGTTVALGNHDHSGTYQPLDAELSAIAGLTSAADKAPYFTGSGAAALMDVTSFARPIMAATTGGAVRSIINAQIGDATLTALAGLSTGADKLPYFTGTDTAAQTDFTSFARTLLDDADAATARQTLGAASTDSPNSAEALGYGCVSIPNLGAASNLTLSSTTRTLQMLIPQKLKAGTYSGFAFYLATAMTGGAASANVYTTTNLASNSWSQVAANVTVTSALTGALGVVQVANSFTAATDVWVRIEIVLTTAPTVYPAFLAWAAIKTTTGGGHVLTGTKNATAAPSSTLDPSAATGGWTDAIRVLWAAIYV